MQLLGPRADARGHQALQVHQMFERVCAEVQFEEALQTPLICNSRRKESVQVLDLLQRIHRALQSEGKYLENYRLRVGPFQPFFRKKFNNSIDSYEDALIS